MIRTPKEGTPYFRKLSHKVLVIWVYKSALEPAPSAIFAPAGFQAGRVLKAAWLSYGVLELRFSGV